jgi:hypothetical protein
VWLFYLSFDVVFKTYARIREHVKKQPTQASYSFVSERLQRINTLFQKWLDIYELYAQGYQSEVLSWSAQFEIWHLAICGNVIEELLSDIFEAKIPKEVYILLGNVFEELNHGPDFYVLIEGDTFRQRSVYEEIYRRSLKDLTPPRPLKTNQIDEVLNFIKEKDAIIFYYDRGEYDNALSWPLLIHEWLHWFYTIEKLNLLEDGCPKVTWIEEALIDIYVTEFFGPAYAASLASYLYSHPHEEAVTHPHFAVRLYISSRYLNQLEKVKESIPPPINTQISETLRYIEQVQNQHQEVVEEVKKDVDSIYDQTRPLIQRLITKKTQPFTELMQEIEQRRRNTMKLPAEKFPEKQILSTDDVQRYYKLGIPVAANPRVLFNSFISGEYLRGGVDTLFIKESLKKWYVREFWKSKISHK